MRRQQIVGDASIYMGSYWPGTNPFFRLSGANNYFEQIAGGASPTGSPPRLALLCSYFWVRLGSSTFGKMGWLNLRYRVCCPGLTVGLWALLKILGNNNQSLHKTVIEALPKRAQRPPESGPSTKSRPSLPIKTSQGGHKDESLRLLLAIEGDKDVTSYGLIRIVGRT